MTTGRQIELTIRPLPPQAIHPHLPPEQILDETLQEFDRVFTHDRALVPYTPTGAVNESKFSPLEEKKPDNTPLRYLKYFTQSEMKELVITYKDLLGEQKEFSTSQAAAQLDALIGKHTCAYWNLFVSLIIAISLNGGYAAFVAKNGGQGIQTGVNVIDSNVQVPTLPANAAGAAMGALDIVMFMLSFSPFKEAATSTLDFLLYRQKPLRTRLRELVLFARHSPHIALCYLLLEPSLLFYNSASMMTVLLGFVPFLSQPALIGLTLIVLTFGNLYMSKYSNKQARDGLFHYWFKRNEPGFFNQLWRGNISSALKSMSLGLSTVILNGFLYFSIGQSIAQAYNGSSDASQSFGIFISFISVIRNFLVMYPLPFHDYFDPRKRLRTLIEKAEARLLKHFPSLQHDRIANGMVKRQEQEVRRHTGLWELLRDDKSLLIQNFCYAAVTLGVGLLTLTDFSPLNILVLAASLLITLLSFKSSLNTTVTQRAIAELEQSHVTSDRQLVPVTSQEIPPETARKLKIAAFILALDAGITDLITVMGSILLDNSALKLLLLMVAFNRLIPTVSFYNDMVYKTLSSFAIKNGSTQTSSNLFKQEKKAMASPAMEFKVATP